MEGHHAILFGDGGASCSCNVYGSVTITGGRESLRHYDYAHKHVSCVHESVVYFYICLRTEVLASQTY